MSTALVVVKKQRRKPSIPRREFTIREHNDLVKMRASGKTYREIGEHLNRTPEALQTYCHRRGIKGHGRNPYKLTKAQQAEAIRMYNNGVTKTALAKHFKVAVTTIKEIPGMPIRQVKDKIIKSQNIPVAFGASLKRRLDAMCKATGITRQRIMREAVRREVDRWERMQSLEMPVREYGA